MLDGSGTYDLDMFVSRANAVVDAHTERKGPLFLYLALHSVHEPDECPAAFYAKFPKVRYYIIKTHRLSS